MSIKSILIWLLVFSFLVVLANDLVFTDTPEIIKWGDEMGQILSNLSLAYISSYIFYYVVVVVQDQRDAHNLKPIIYNLNSRIHGRARHCFYALRATTPKVEGPFGVKWETLTIEEIISMCDSVNPKNLSLNFGSRIVMDQDETVGEVLYRVGVLQVQPDLDRLMVYMKFLSTEHIRLLDAIRDSRFFDMTGSMMASKRIGNNSLSVWAKDIFEFFAAAKALEEYNQIQFLVSTKSKKRR